MYKLTDEQLLANVEERQAQLRTKIKNLTKELKNLETKAQRLRTTIRERKLSDDEDEDLSVEGIDDDEDLDGPDEDFGRTSVFNYKG